MGFLVDELLEQTRKMQLLLRMVLIDGERGITYKVEFSEFKKGMIAVTVRTLIYSVYSGTRCN